MSSKVQVGDVWNLRYSSQMAIVVCVWQPNEFAEDIRIVPVSLRAGGAEMLADRDVVVHSDETINGRALVAHAWLSESASSADLEGRVDHVTDTALEAVRNAELVGIAPDAEARDSDRRGAPVVDETDPRLSTMRVVAEGWAAARSLLQRYAFASEFLVAKVKMPKDLFSGTNQAVMYTYASVTMDASELLGPRFLPAAPPAPPPEVAANSNLALAA